MAATPRIVVTKRRDLFADKLGQLWSPATISVTWDAEAEQGLPGPSVLLDVIAPATANMTDKVLHLAHLTAGRDVLRAALLAL